MNSAVKQLTVLSSIVVGVILIFSSFAQVAIATTGPSPASASAPGVLSSSPLATTASTTNPNSTQASPGAGSNASLDWTEDTGVGSTGSQGWDYSPQTQITSSNINQLAISYVYPIPSIWDTIPAWDTRFRNLTYSVSLEGTQAPVLSSQGLGFVITNGLSVYAFSLADGHQIFNANPSMDWGYYQKQPWAVGGAPGHLHGVDMVDGIIWVPGFGCQVQGWDTTGALKANLTGLCNNIPGDYSPNVGWGQYYSYGDSAVQVDVKNNVILFNVGGSAEGTGQGRMFIAGCSLSAALAGQNCVANGGPCTTEAGGVCSAGSTMLWRTFFFPPLDGKDPTFSTDVCANAHVWIAGVPCSAVPANVIAGDWQDNNMKQKWNGTNIGPSSGLSNTWGNYAIDDQDNLFFVGTSQTAPDWNASLRPGPNLLGDSIVGLNLTNGQIVWADKSIAKDLNDYDCNLNVIYAQVQGQKMVLKTCKSGVVYGINAITGQPNWILDTTMPNYKNFTSSLSQPFECKAGNTTSCNFGAMWDKIWAQYTAGTIPKPHGYITYPPYRAGLALDPTNATEMTQFVCPVGTNAQCQALAGVGTVTGCPETTTATGCPSLGQLGKKGFIEGRYFAESEDSFDGRYYYITVMDGPMEHDYISNVDYKGESGLTFDVDLYFSGQMPTNTTVLKIDPMNGNVVWSYQRPIYYRGGLLVTGGMVVTQWPDGHLIFLDANNGQVLRDMSFGTPLLAPMSIAPDALGNMHLLVTYGGTIHPVLGDVGLHGPLGHGAIIPGAVISLALGTGTGGAGTAGVGGTTATATVVLNTVNTYAYEFYAAIGVAALLAIVVGVLAIMRRRPAA